MKKFLYAILLLTMILSCERKPLYLHEDVGVNIFVTAYASIDSIWGEHWRDSLVYQWDESEYGRIGYTIPEIVQCWLKDNDSICRKSDFTIGYTQNMCFLKMYTPYEMLLYNPEQTHVERMTTDEYIISSDKQPGEVFNVYIPNICITEVNISRESYINGVYTYIYDMNVCLKPITYIYILQFIIKDDIQNPEITGIDYIDINGLTDYADLKLDVRRPYRHTIMTTNDIKPVQMRSGHNLYAARFTTFGPAEIEENGSWGIKRPDNTINIHVSSRTLETAVISIDLTKKFIEKPNGGIITVYIDGTQLVDKQKDGWWQIDLEEWNENIIDIVI